MNRGARGNTMKTKPKSTPMKRSRSGCSSVRHGGFGVYEGQHKTLKDVSLTPDTFELSRARQKKKAIRRRSSLNYHEFTTQITENRTQLYSDHGDGALEHTPETLSQISAIDISINDTIRSKLGKKAGRATGSDDTLEMAVQYARGEPDGAERSFTSKFISKMSLSSKQDNDQQLEEIQAESDIDKEFGTPAKKPRAASNMKINSLKVPFKQASKKLKSLKSTTDTQRARKEVNKNFGALPDETIVPKTPRRTWKEKKQQRKMMKNNYNLITAAKKAWEDLRRANLHDSERKKICDDLMHLVIGKMKELAVVHDSSRIIQCLVQYGSEDQRIKIFEELQGDFCELCKMKYAKFIVRKLIHYGSREMRGQIFRSFHGQVCKLMRHKEACEVVEYAYSDYATAPQRLAMLEEFYGPTFSLFKDHAHQTLDQVMVDQPEKRSIVIRSMQETLMPLIDKQILAFSLIHKVFHDFFMYADIKSRKDTIECVREHVPSFLHTRDGTRVAMMCIWYGSTKDRKAVVKSLKTHVVKVCKEECGHLLLMSIFDCIDDTVLVQRVILDEMIKSLDEVIQDQHGRKVLLYLLCPRDSHHFHPDIVKVLQEGDCNPTSKKDMAVRAEELKSFISPHLIKYLENHVESMMSNTSLALLVKAIIMNASGDVVPGMRAIANLVVQPCNSTDGAINMVEHPACHIALKKIIANDKARMEAGKGILFSAILLEALPKSTIKVWAASNRGCFILVSLLEVGCTTITENVKYQLQPVLRSLSKMTFKGAEILLSKLGIQNKPREYKV